MWSHPEAGEGGPLRLKFIHRVRGRGPGGRSPLLGGWPPTTRHERVWNPPAPLLFQKCPTRVFLHTGHGHARGHRRD